MTNPSSASCSNSSSIHYLLMLILISLCMRNVVIPIHYWNLLPVMGCHCSQTLIQSLLMILKSWRPFKMNIPNRLCQC
jgi:hypothetical protein